MNLDDEAEALARLRRGRISRPEPKETVQTVVPEAEMRKRIEDGKNEIRAEVDRKLRRHALESVIFYAVLALVVGCIIGVAVTYGRQNMIVDRLDALERR